MSAFIVFEGSDACGKTTQASLLAARIRARLTKEPGGTRAGARIRSLLLDHSPEGASLSSRAEALLMAADRAQHVSEVIEPTLRAGQHVVCDRYIGSSIAYQAGGRGLPADQIRYISEWATTGLWPDVVVLLRVPLDVVIARLSAAGVPDRLESEGADFLRRVMDSFDAQAAADPERWRVIDGMGTIEEVQARVQAAVAPFLA